MKLYFVLQADAQTWCDGMHSKLIAANSAYANSVSKGLTKRWHIPAQDLDPKTLLAISTEWYTVSDDRSDPCLTTAERAALLPGDAVKTTITPLI